MCCANHAAKLIIAYLLFEDSPVLADEIVEKVDMSVEQEQSTVVTVLKEKPGKK